MPTPGAAAAASPQAWPRSSSSLASLPAATEAAAPLAAPEAPWRNIPAANITVVRTPEELQRATLSGAVDIEIRAHLDLRSLHRAANPAILREETHINRKTLALLYATPPLRSIRGNCSVPGAEAALGLPPGTFPDLLPLKPRQCLILVPDTWLMVNEGNVWVDNVYLKLSRRRVLPSFAFITAGALEGELQWPNIHRSSIYMTGITFHGEHRGNARGVVCDFTGIQLTFHDCIFTDWAGFSSPITIKYQSVATMRKSVFRNMYLHVEVVDVSFEGMVHFQDVLFTNVSLQHGAVVSTTGNDYQSAVGFYLTYYAEDDANYDVPLSIVPLGSQTVFQEQLAVMNSTMSDCVYMHRSPDSVLPGCPVRANAARIRSIDRSYFTINGRESSGVPFDGAALDYSYRHRDYVGAMADDPASMPVQDYYGYDPYMYVTSEDGVLVYAAGPVGDVELDYDHRHYRSQQQQRQTLTNEYTDYEVFDDPWKRFRVMTEDSWLEWTMEVLPEQAPAPGWPPFLPPPPPPQERTSLRPGPTQPSPAAAEKMLGPLDLTSHTSHTQEAHACGGVSVMAMWLIMAAEVLVVAALVWVLVAKGRRITRWFRRKWKWFRNKRDNGWKCFQLSKGTPSPHDVPSVRRGNGQQFSSPPRDHDDLSRGTSDVTTGANAPASILNSQFEYCLPPHLAFFTRLDSLDPGTCTSESHEPGGTKVAAPYTIDVSPAASTFSSARARAGSTPGALDQAGVQLTHRPRALDTVNEDAVEVESGDKDSAEPGSVRVHSAGVAPTTFTAANGPAGRRLQRQLDSFTADTLFLARFQMLGRRHRRRGGQAVVQFAQSRHERAEFAVKFFLDWDAFLTEAALYAAAFPGVCSTSSPEVTARAQAVSRLVSASGKAFMPRDISKFLPQVEAVCDGAADGMTDPWGRPLPPCIVMEKGESLQDQCNRAEPDIFTILAVLSNVSSRIAVMHALGYVHRDLKPANVMWLPRQNRWTVIDFGCVARVGEEAPLSFSLAYAAPEVVVACRDRKTRIAAQPALDAWSLGVMAFELLTGAPAFDFVSSGRCKVMAMLAGDVPLPWEGELSEGVQRSLGVFKEPVLRLLHRDPALRISLDAFHSSCTRSRLFSTQMSDASSH